MTHDWMKLTAEELRAKAAADALVIVTEWKEFQSADWAKVKKSMKGTFVFDGRNILPRVEIEALGLVYQGIGV